MKKYGFYGLVLLQVGLILFFAIEFERFETTGREIKLLGRSTYVSSGTRPLSGDITVNYSVSSVEKKHYSGDIPIDRLESSTPLYALLQPDESGIFQLVDISNKRLVASPDEVVFKVYSSINEYGRETFGVAFPYEMRQIENLDQYGSFTDDDRLIVTIIFSKWGQYKVIDVEKVS